MVSFLIEQRRIFIEVKLCSFYLTIKLKHKLIIPEYPQIKREKY